MKLPEMPELPESDGESEVIVGQQRLLDGMMADVSSYIPAWSEELVRAFAIQYGELCVRAERERAPWPSLSALNDLAKLYANSYASPHHMTFSVEGLRRLIAAAIRSEE